MTLNSLVSLYTHEKFHNIFFDIANNVILQYKVDQSQVSLT